MARLTKQTCGCVLSASALVNDVSGSSGHRSLVNDETMMILSKLLRYFAIFDAKQRRVAVCA